MMRERIRGNGDMRMRSIRAISTTVAFLLLGFAAAAYGRQEKQEEKPPKQEPAKPQQQEQAKPQQQQHAQQQANSDKQQQQHSQQQAKSQQDQQQKQQHSEQQAHLQPVKMQSSQEQHRQEGEQSDNWQQHRAHNWQSEHRDWQQRGGYNGYRIPDDRYNGYFGSSHSFRIYSYPVVIVGGYPRFQYGGYWFSLVDPWPEYWSDNWYDNDDVYIDYSSDGYYLYNRRYPRDRIAVSVYLN
jgi:flagellar motor protein MotB